MASQPFWKRKTLAEMSTEEWESLCDGCGKCCLQKLEDEDSGEVFYTRIVCQYLSDNCRCTVYSERQKKVPDCICLKPEDVEQFFWLPDTCAYRLIAEGEDLPDWHPLIAHDSQRIHAVDASVLHLEPVRDNEVPEEDWEDYIIDTI